MDTQIDLRYAGLSLAELKAQALDREHAAEQAVATQELAEHQASVERWNVLLEFAKGDLHPELFARVSVQLPEQFTSNTDGWALTIELPQHSPIKVTYYYKQGAGWYRAVNSNYRKTWFDVTYYTKEYGESSRYVKSQLRFVFDLGNALLDAEREYQNGIALKAEVDKENAERAAAQRARIEHEAQAPNPTPDEILLSTLKEWLRGELTILIG